MASYELSYGGISFRIDHARVLRACAKIEHEVEKDEYILKKHQPEDDFIDELNRLIPFQYLNDFNLPSFQGKVLTDLDRPYEPMDHPNPTVRIGDWYYPNSASRWSVFRGLADSTQVKAMLANQQPNTFIMKSVPAGVVDHSIYTLQTSMYMLPPRPLGEVIQGNYDGLYLVTLVDERFYFQGSPVLLHLDRNSTWESIANELALTLGIALIIDPIPAIYGKPEVDSQLWSTWESAQILLDAVASNVGCVIVRNLDGGYDLQPYNTANTLVNTNRANAILVGRSAGGNIFEPNSKQAGNLSITRDLIVPSFINVAFPSYITGDDPVPHFLNARNANHDRTSWVEDSYGEMHLVSIPITSGGIYVSGLTGVGDHTVKTTAKALYSGEISVSGTPYNYSSGLYDLASQIAQDQYAFLAGPKLDEVFIGTFKWEPEAFHDIIWTYSARARQATCRVIRPSYTNKITHLQHSISEVPGRGGKSVAQVIRDSANFSGSVISNTLDSTIASGDFSAIFDEVNHFPTQNRWRGLVDSERILFEGTSGGTTVGIVQRAIDGTLLAQHTGGTSVTYLPDIAYGVNLTTYEKSQYIFPGEYTSGGITGAKIVPQIQSVRALTGSGIVVSGSYHYSGRVFSYDITRTDPWVGEEFVWLAPRNSGSIQSGGRYGGLLVGHSPTIAGSVAPVYVIGDSVPAAGGGGSTSGFSLIVNEAQSGSPSFSGIGTIRVSYSGGLRILSPSSGSVTIYNDPADFQGGGLSGTPINGVLTHVAQEIGGEKTWYDGSHRYRSASSPSGNIQLEWNTPTGGGLWRLRFDGNPGRAWTIGPGNGFNANSSGCMVAQLRDFIAGDKSITLAVPPSPSTSGSFVIMDGIEVGKTGQLWPGATAYGGVITSLGISGSVASGSATGTVTHVATSGSITGGPIIGSGVLSLVNDHPSPGNSKYYGTDTGGSKGFHTLPVGVGETGTLTGGAEATDGSITDLGTPYGAIGNANTSPDDPPTQADFNALVGTVNDILDALRDRNIIST